MCSCIFNLTLAATNVYQKNTLVGKKNVLMYTYIFGSACSRCVKGGCVRDGCVRGGCGGMDVSGGRVVDV